MTPAIENVTFPAYFGTDACVAAKIILELNLIDLVDICLFPVYQIFDLADCKAAGAEELEDHGRQNMQGGR